MQLIMEYVPLGSLRDYLPKHNVSLAHILLFAQQICEVKPKPSRLLPGAPLLPKMSLTPPKMSLTPLFSPFSRAWPICIPSTTSTGTLLLAMCCWRMKTW